MPPKKSPLTPAQILEQKEKKNAQQRARYARKSQEVKERKKTATIERRKFVNQNKSQEEKEDNFAEMAKRRRIQLTKETPEQRDRRHTRDAERHRIIREEESLQQAHSRREDQALRTISLREEESLQETVTRKLRDRIRHRENIESESVEEASRRREVNRQQTMDWRNTENAEESSERRSENVERMAQLRVHQDEMDAIESEAQVHVDIEPVETQEERDHRERFLLDIRPTNARLRTHKRAQKEIVSENEVKKHHAGKMDIICESCGAVHFKGEKSSDKKFSLCCNKGKVILPSPKKCPEPLHSLLTNCHPKSSDFINNARRYNNALAFASMGAQIKIHQGRGPSVFTINGQLYHNTSAVEFYDEHMSTPPPTPKYAQLYFLDSATANNFRMELQANMCCDRNLMKQLDRMIRDCNPYAALYKNMNLLALEENRKVLIENTRPKVVGMVIHNDRRTQDERRYNSPTGDEIGVVFSSQDGAPPENRDIRGHLLIPQRGKKFIRINTQKPMCDPMTYPLLFPNGDNGWDHNLRHNVRANNLEETNDIDRILEERQLLEEESNSQGTYQDVDETVIPQEPEPEHEAEVEADPDDVVPIFDVRRRSRITQCKFYSNKLSVPPAIFNPVLYGGSLTQQFIVDSYVKVEANRINYLKTHQNDLHVAQYNGLMDYITNRAERENITVGTPVILPSSFIGSPRAMKQGYQDAMAICGKYGKPTYFLTFTCNPNWPEITESIESYQKAANRPDIVARVFQLKLKELIKDIQENQILGVVVARIHVIEFQKRGLPHVHMLIWIHESDVPKTEEEIDKTTCAEIPDPDTHPELHKIIMSSMIHGPCGTNNRNSP